MSYTIYGRNEEITKGRISILIEKFLEKNIK